MKAALTIASREIRSHLTTPAFYVVSAAFVVLAGFFYFSILAQFNTVLQRAALHPDISPSLNDQVVEPYFRLIEAVLIFMVPILTMRALSEEKHSGTFEFLMTAPVSVPAIIWGKFLAYALLLSAMLLLTFIFPLTLLLASNPEAAPIFIGFFGLVVAGWAFIALGIAVSCFTESQVIAGVMTLVLLLLLHVLDVPAGELPVSLANVLEYLTPRNHVKEFLRGVVACSDLVYLLSMTACGIFAACRALEMQRWR
jgi:ABC-2 type transport system permease protein